MKFFQADFEDGIKRWVVNIDGEDHLFSHWHFAMDFAVWHVKKMASDALARAEEVVG